MIGQTLSHYKVLEKIGEGGMGEVYRATDTKLNRDVALKILPQQFASDSQRMGRFQREAEVLASLDHPNIGQIYGIEDAGQTKALVLQLIEGPTLAERMAQGPIPVEEALKIALQMAEGLEAAHEKGVIHRDLKPANIKITPEDQVKILDFGLAKALEGETPSPSELSQSPTLTAAATQAGVILGTAAYMSPEQARGKPTDRRADIWAIGVVLFEMLSGKRAFEGEDVSQTLAAVIMTEPDWSLLPSETPGPILQLLKRCLDREPYDRLQAIGEFRIAVSRYLADPFDPLALPVADAVQAPQRLLLPWVLAAVVLTGVTVGVAVWNIRPTPQPVAARFSHQLPAGQEFSTTGRPLVAVSPDGSQIIYVANQQLYLRNLGEMTARPIQGTDENPANPFFSPDGEWVGFISGSDSQLKKIATVGGAPVTLCDVGASFGASWGSDGTILYGQPEGIMRVSANGGVPELIIPTEAPEQVDSPQMLPGGEWVLFTLTSVSSPGRWDEAQIVVHSLESGERKILWEGGSDARYVPTGHLAFTLADVLFALPFDLVSLEVSGGPVPIVEGVEGAGNNLTATGTANYGFSDNGTLIYRQSRNTRRRMVPLVWVDREGQEEPLAAEPQDYIGPRISPDGSRLAITISESGDHDVWIYDLEREIPTRLTFDPAADHFLVWMPDGQRIVFDSSRVGGGHNLFWRAADGTGQVERLTSSPNNQTAHSISPDGKSLVFTENVPRDLQVLSMEGEHTSQPLFQSPFNERYGAISPDGHWIAYQSDESGQFQVYVRPFPNAEEGKWQISRDGGTEPVWAPRGQELFYRNGQSMMAVAIQTEPTFTQGSPVVLFTGRYRGVEPVVNYDISPDGKRFLMIKAADEEEEQAGQINIVLNWFEELKRLVPTP